MKKVFKYMLVGFVGLVAMYLFLDFTIDGYIKELELIEQYNKEYYNKMF